MSWRKQSLALAISGTLVLATAQTGCAYGGDQFTPAPTLQIAPSPIALDQLVAPIALYPDNLVAQILAASTWPTEVVEADRWVRQHPALKGAALARAVDQQAWDPSVKGLTQFPLVLANMDQNLSWSSALGNAYAAEPRTVFDAIQAMRRRAQQAGHLTGNSHEVVTNDGDTIIIEPADSETVYLPEYNPWLIYGAPMAVYPGWAGVPGLYVTEPDVLFDLGFGIGTLAAFDWGWHHWDADWHHRNVAFNHAPYHFHGDGFGDQLGFHGAHMAFAPSHEFGGGMWHGTFGAGNRGFRGLNRGGFAGGFGARGGLGFGGAFHIAAGGFHGGGFHGGGHR